MSNDAKAQRRTIDASHSHPSGVSPVSERYDADAERIARALATPAEARIFALGGGCTAVLEAIDGASTLRQVFVRAGVPLAEGMTYVATLAELGLITLE